MIPSFNQFLQKIFTQVLETTPENETIYLVGGAVRDLLLNKPINDLDFVVRDQTRQISHRVARSLHAQSFLLDDERQTARVIYRLADGKQILLDFVTFTGDDLYSDLLNRDFTINAMAIDLHSPMQLIDPMEGAEDLKNAVLRTCSPQSMLSDPLRVLRGIRIALDYSLQITPASKILMKKASSSLGAVSSERKRDELFKILDTIQPDLGIRLMDHLDCIPAVLPELLPLKEVPASVPHVHDLWEHTLKTVNYLSKIYEVLTDYEGAGKVKTWSLGFMATRLWEYRRDLKEHLIRPIQAERSRRDLLLLAALYHDTGKVDTVSEGSDQRLHYYGHANESEVTVINRAQELCLSNREVEWLAGVVRYHMRIHQMAQSKDVPTAKAIYRFFRDTDELGVDICLLSLADILATFEGTLKQSQWINEVEIVYQLLNAWWHQKETVVDPPKLLDGNDLQELFKLEPGPMFSEILESLREAQADKKIMTWDEALDFVQQFLKD
ncbi:MAG: HD domain-containing protein [Chloroflexota bacterium]